MKTKEDAEHVLSLFAERDEIQTAAEQVLAGKVIAACGVDWRGTFIFQHLGDEVRDLVRREAAMRVAEIEAELRKLGIEP